MKRRALILALFALACLREAGGEELRVDLRLETRVPAGHTVTVDQVARLLGPLAGRAGEVPLLTAPGLRVRQWLEGETVLQALEAAGIGRETVRLTGAPRVLVIGAGEPPCPEKVIPALESLLKNPGQELTARLLNLRFPVGAEVPAGDYSVTAELPPAGLRTGTLLIPLTLTYPEGHSERITAQARVEVRGPVVVAARDLPRGHKLAPDDLRLELRPLRPGVRMLNDPAELRGMATRGILKAGEPLRAAAVIKPFSVEPGKVVRATFRKGSVDLDLETMARSRGQIGDVVAIDGLDGKRLMARVIEEGKVLVLGSEESESAGTAKEAL